jgi:hypothetical protein
VQVDPIEPKLKPPGTKRLKLNCDILLSTSAFRFNLRRNSVEHTMLGPGDKEVAVELLRGRGYTVSEDDVLHVGEDLLAWHTASCP